MASWRDDWVDREIPEDEWPVEHPNPIAKVKRVHRRTAKENRPGLSKFYCDVYGADRELVGGVRIGFDTAPSEAIAYDHPNAWGLTGGRKGNLGHLEYEHPRTPTRYMVYVNEVLVLSNLRLDLGYEYIGGGVTRGTWRPVNRPGVYSYDLEFELLEEV